ncbi:hypothetical protein WJX73_009198 [Symbiochloris irregularis]|uniref:Uncharacterized protein n=1 Tax=Symbiochloris irregularis TaxID=706552 RepID=A0AAW1PBZ1_9CHLO
MAQASSSGPSPVEGATTRVPKGFKKVLAVHFGAGYDRHGQDATAAALQALERAMENTTSPGIVNFVPGGYAGVKVKAKIGVPAHESVDKEELRAAVIFAKPENVEIKVVPGGLRWHSGVVLPKLGDAAKHDGKPVDEEYDSSDDEDELAGVNTAKDDVFAAIAAVRVGF